MLALKVCYHLPFNELKALYRKTVKSSVARRYLAILKLYVRENHAIVADELFITPQIVRKWIHRWNEQGPRVLTNLPQSGQHPFLSEEQKAELIQDILKSPRELDYDYSKWMLKIIAEHIKRRYGIEITFSSIWRIIKHHDMTRLIPRLLPANADPNKTRTSEEKEANTSKS